MGTPWAKGERRGRLGRFFAVVGVTLHSRFNFFAESQTTRTTTGTRPEENKASAKRSSFPGAVPNDPDPDGYTALHAAAFWNRLELVRLLMERRADVNARASNGCTPLHEAARLNSIEVARELLGAGARVNATDNEGRTPFSWVGRHGEGDQMIDLLTSFGGNK